MGQTLSLRIKGLHTNPNSLDPNLIDGALSIADNIVIDSDNIGSSRRGFEKYNQYINFGGFDKYISSMFNYQDTLLIHYNNKIAKDPEDSGTWDEYTGNFSVPDTEYRIRGIEENQNLYICTDSGVKRLDKIDGDFEDAGMVSALDGLGSATGSGWFTAGVTVAYRMIWVKEDNNNNLIAGAPSSRLIVANATGSDSNVSLTFLIPSDITTSHRYQIYRSNVTETLTDTPNDEMQLVKEGSPSAGDIAAKQFTVLDELAADLRGVTLYTSPSEQGISNASYEPPFCKDMTSFKDHMIYANTKVKNYFEIMLLGTGTGGFEEDDTITIDGVVFTGKTSEDTDADEFKVYSSGTPAADIQDTAFSLVKIINKSASNTSFYAYYESGFEDVPGKIKLVSRSLGADPFYITTSRPVAWTPDIPVSGESAVSRNDIKVNRVFVSKQSQPDAVPLYYYLDVGSANQPIKRVIGLRDSVFIFKDDGIFRITGETFNNFSVTLFDNTVKLLSPESVVALNNTVFAMTLQGVCSISDTGVAVVSRAIEKDLLKMIQYPYFNKSSFAISYESDRKYILFCPNSANQEYPTIAYCYNTFTNSWTRWIFTATSGVIKNTDDKLYLGGKLLGYQQGWVHKERKTFSLLDYIDDSWGVGLTNVSNTDPNYTSLTLSRSQDVVVGYWVTQVNPHTGVRVTAKIESLDGTTVKVYPKSTLWVTDPSYQVEIVQPIVCRLKWVQNTALNPGILKHFRDAIVFFKQDTFSEIKIGYETNYQPGYAYTTLSTIDEGDWSNFDWGTLPWHGLDETFNQAVRVGIPRQKQKCLWISFSIEGSNAFTSFSVAGISANFENISERLTPNSRF